MPAFYAADPPPPAHITTTPRHHTTMNCRSELSIYHAAPIYHTTNHELLARARQRSEYLLLANGDSVRERSGGRCIAPRPPPPPPRGETCCWAEPAFCIARQSPA